MRSKIIKEALNCNDTQAMIYDQVLKDIPDDKLIDFFVFRMRFIEPMKSNELITKEALFDYRRRQHIQKLKNGEMFGTKEQLQDFLQTYYRGKDIGSGIRPFYDYVIIAIDREGNFINKYAVNDFGNFKKLNSEDIADVIDDLFNNPRKIGNVDYMQSKQIVYQEPKKYELEDMNAEHNKDINLSILPRTKAM